jgi:CHRD domain-containing protein
VRRAVALVILVAASAVACGGSPQAAATTPTPSSSASPSPNASPSATGLLFTLNGINTSASGKITVTVSPTSTTIELVVSGLAADSSHVSHVHSGSCQHPGGILYALNQVVADGTGAADTRTTISAHYPPASGRWYVVVHAGPDMQGANATYLLCGNLF